MQKEVLTYLNQDFLSNAGLIEVILRDTAVIIQADNSGVFLKDTISGVYMIATDDTKKAIEWISSQKDIAALQCQNQVVFQWVKEHSSLKNGMECFQVVYTKREKKSLTEKLKIRKIQKEEEDIVQNNYKKLSKEELHEICNRGNLYVGILDGQMIGFIGNHLEGSIGLLEVFEPYRRNGYANELQSFMINLSIDRNEIAYGQVETDNLKSFRLQQKLGLKVAQKKIYWNY